MGHAALGPGPREGRLHVHRGALCDGLGVRAGGQPSHASIERAASSAGT